MQSALPRVSNTAREPSKMLWWKPSARMLSAAAALGPVARPGRGASTKFGFKLKLVPL